MTRVHAPYYGKRFIGDAKKRVVHDQMNERKYSTANACRIDEIRAEYVKTFNPDRLEIAVRKGFKPCPHCLPAQQSF